MAHRINSILPDEAQIEMFARLSWDKLRPERPWVVIQNIDDMQPIMHTHRRYVRAYFENNFDPEATIRQIANGRLRDMDETGEAFHLQLSAMLKDMSKKFFKK